MVMPSFWDKLLDASLLWSFERRGFERHARRFDPSDATVDLHGAHVMITGGNSGIGLATADLLLGHRATVHLLCRSRARGDAAWKDLAARHPGAQGSVEEVDVASLRSIRALRDRVTLPHLHALIHCAGIAPEARQLSEDGLELQWATHVVGPAALTLGLWTRLQGGGRVVFVSSGGMYTARLRASDPEFQHGPYDKLAVYAHHKRMQLELARRWQRDVPAGDIAFHAMHPGWVDTPLLQKEMPSFHRRLRGVLRTPAQGADTVAWLASSPKLQGVPYRFWFDRAPAPEHTVPWTRTSPADLETLFQRVMRQASLPGVAAPNPIQHAPA
jgi:dehydrogenase/reductase SDR family protein 12